MAEENILIIGAGAAGLMAARELLKAGKKVTILEAQQSAGGRILDVKDAETGLTVKLGAEFVHGNLPLTLSLLDEAGIKYEPFIGESYVAQEGQLLKDDEFDPFWPQFMEKLTTENSDMTLTEFLSKNFSGEGYKELRQSVLRFAQGYDAADPDKVSVLSLQKEWQQEEQPQYSIRGGYGQLINFLHSDCIEKGCLFLFNKVVNHFNWSEGFVEAITAEGERYSGVKAIVTLPLGVLQIKDGSLGFVNFTPPLPIRMGAVRALGFGSVLKVVLIFKEAFWQQQEELSGFTFSEEKIPTWWMQASDEAPVLTGWLAGPATQDVSGKSEAELLDLALTSLSNLFKLSVAQLEGKLLKGYALNWADNPFSRGAYAYATVDEPHAAEVLGKPVESTIYFSGEGTYEGPYAGTVEAALVSGQEAARKVLEE